MQSEEASLLVKSVAKGRVDNCKNVGQRSQSCTLLSS